MSRFLGIARDPQFSPGKVDVDRAILEQTAANLREAGHDVVLFAESDDPWPEPAPETIVFTMSQGRAALQRLRTWEKSGIRVVNRPEAILNCQRHRTVLLLAGSECNYPTTAVIDDLAAPNLPAWIKERGAWIKRGDVHAIDADDVAFCADRAAAREALRSLAARGVERAVVQQHVAGRVIKFYGVHRHFFHCVQAPDDLALDPNVVRRIDAIGRLGAAALGVEIYGGDCVVDPSGMVHLIDLNDWPSYGPCRFSAAKSIATYLKEVASS